MRQPAQRWKEVEISTSDCIWLLAGALTCRQYFHEDHEIVDLATLLYSRYDFPWMTNGDGKLLSHGWRPEGFIALRYEKYCQLAAMYLLGIGSPTHPLPPDAWYAWERDPNSYGQYNYIGKSLLWTYQYPFAWFDFRGTPREPGHEDRLVAELRDRDARASRVVLHRSRQGISRLHRDHLGNHQLLQPQGYTRRGVGRPSTRKPDGSVVPCAAGGSLMITPDICIPALHAMKDKYGDKIWGKYGFADAFNPLTGWVSTDTLGLDVGMTLLSAENLRTGNVWKWFMANPEPQTAMQLAGIEKV